MRREIEMSKDRDGLTQRVATLESEHDELVHQREMLRDELGGIRQQTADVQRKWPEQRLQDRMLHDASKGLRLQSANVRHLRDTLNLKSGTFALLNQDDDESGFGSIVTDGPQDA